MRARAQKLKEGPKEENKAVKKKAWMCDGGARGISCQSTEDETDTLTYRGWQENGNR